MCSKSPHKVQQPQLQHIRYVLQTNENEMAHSQQQRRRRRRRLIKVPEEISNEIRSTDDNNNDNDNKSRSFEMDIGYDTAKYGMT